MDIISKIPAGWEQWSNFATILAVVVNGVFLFFLIRQVRQGHEAIREAKRSADAAHRSVKEAIHTRIDTQAPRVICILDNPTLGAVVNDSEMAWKADHELVIPRDSSKKMYVGVTGMLINEGKGTARVNLNGSAEFITDDDEEDLLIGPISGSNAEHILRPGESIRIIWTDFHTVSDWIEAFEKPSPPNPKGACFMEIVVSDSYKQGVVDHIYLEMSGRPITPMDGKEGHWQITGQEFKAIAYPIERAHLREENHLIKPPWLDVYK